ncbi:MAG: NAD(P)H-binding protein, partial [Emcibacteraceae bacterium]|nr:NAD(P)H-binding protein [Emcibacteraceae bacterium]
MTKTIALTGATGFVGGHLLHSLVSRGFIVKALTRRPQKNIDNVTWISGDFENCSALKELLKDVDVIINVAGLVKAKNKND